MAWQKDYNLSRALEHVNLLQVDNIATKKTGEQWGQWIETLFASLASPEIKAKITSATDQLVQKAILQFTPAIFEYKKHSSSLIAKELRKSYHPEPCNKSQQVANIAKQHEGEFLYSDYGVKWSNQSRTDLLPIYFNDCDPLELFCTDGICYAPPYKKPFETGKKKSFQNKLQSEVL